MAGTNEEVDIWSSAVSTVSQSVILEALQAEITTRIVYAGTRKDPRRCVGVSNAQDLERRRLQRPGIRPILLDHAGPEGVRGPALHVEEEGSQMMVQRKGAQIYTTASLPEDFLHPDVRANTVTDGGRYTC